MEIETEKKCPKIIVGKLKSSQVDQLINLSLLNSVKKKSKNG